MRIVPRFAVAAAIALVMMCSPFARAQVLQSVPSEAVLVVKVKNIQDVSAKVAALSQQWGLANIRPELNDPLGTLLTAANLGPGLDKAGEAALAMLDFGQHGGEPNMVILIPVTDFKAFAGSLPNAKPDGDMMSFSMGGNPQPGYASGWGKYAALSPTAKRTEIAPAERILRAVLTSPAFRVRCGKATFDLGKFLDEKGILILDGSSSHQRWHRF